MIYGRLLFDGVKVIMVIGPGNTGVSKLWGANVVG